MLQTPPTPQPQLKERQLQVNQVERLQPLPHHQLLLLQQKLMLNQYL